METNTSSRSPLPTHPRGHHYDVVVVGGRAAGAATAMLLARAGLRVLVLERGADGTDTLSTHALMRGGVMQLRRWGLLDAMVDGRHSADPPDDVHATPASGWRSASRRRTESTRCTRLGAPFSIHRSPPPPWMQAREIRYRTAVIDLLRSRRPGRSGFAPGTLTARSRTSRAGLVVGADGVSSIVAQLVGAELLHRGRHATAITYGYWTGLQTTGYEWVYRPERLHRSDPDQRRPGVRLRRARVASTSVVVAST